MCYTGVCSKVSPSPALVVAQRIKSFAACGSNDRKFVDKI